MAYYHNFGFNMYFKKIAFLSILYVFLIMNLLVFDEVSLLFNCQNKINSLIYMIYELVLHEKLKWSLLRFGT